jgi:hypothetical protein
LIATSGSLHEPRQCGVVAADTEESFGRDRPTELSQDVADSIGSGTEVAITETRDVKHQARADAVAPSAATYAHSTNCLRNSQTRRYRGQRTLKEVSKAFKLRRWWVIRIPLQIESSERQLSGAAAACDQTLAQEREGDHTEGLP